MTRSAILTVLLLTFTLAQVNGQQNKKEDTESGGKYKSFKSSRQSASSLLRDAYAIKDTKPGEALNKVEEALGISVAQNDTYNEAKCYVLIGEINESIQEWKLAQDNYRTAYDKLKGRYTNSEEFVKALKGLGNTSLRLKQFSQALQHFQEILSMKGHTNDDEMMLAVAEVYYQQGDYDAAQTTLSQIHLGKDYNRDVAAGIENLEARIKVRKNELENPSAVYDKSVNSLDAEQKVTPTQAQAIEETKEELSESLRGQQRYNDDVELRNKSITFNQKINNLEGVAKDNLALSKSLVDLGENTAALNALKEAARIADTLDNPEAKADAYLALANFYEKDKKENLALESYRKYSDAIRSTKKIEAKANEQREELLKKQREIESLSKEVSLSQEQERYELLTVERQKLVIYGLLVIILIIATTSYFIYKNAVASKVANQLLALKSLRSQMNPHFIFNALNSVNHFIAQQDERTANKFLSEFSLLMRLVLENSQEDFIPLHKEQEILGLYLKLEHYRFRDKFDYTIDIDEAINAEAIEVPPMLIQPYIENAVWHGLRYKEAKGHLLLKFQQIADKLFVEIHDDGIGRKKSAALKTINQRKHNSTGLRNIQERLKILNTVYKTQYSVDIHDLAEGEGTVVKIGLPINHPKRTKL